MTHARTPAFLLVLAAMTATGVSTLAVPQPAASVGVAAKVDVGAFTAQSALRATMLELRALQTPTPRDFAITAELLGIVQEVAPDDVEVVRRRAEAAWNAGDEALLLQLSSRIVELDRTDTVALLRVITARIGRLQEAEERLATYEALLGPKGAGIDPSIRSRLALDCAMLHRERGDETGFVERLKQSIKLDSTNKDAALLALTFFSSRVDDRRGRIELLANLLMADPLDPKTHELLRDEFSRAGAWAATRRFHDLQGLTMRTAGLSMGEMNDLESVVLGWMNEGSEKTVDILTRGIESRRATARFENSINRDKVQNSLMRPEEHRLEIPYEQIRAVAAHWMGPAGEDALKASMADLVSTVKFRTDVLADDTRRPANIARDAAIDQVRNVVVELQIFRLMLGIEVQKSLEELDAQIKDLPADDHRAVAGRAWQAVIAGKPDEVLAIAPEVDGSRWSDLARARALEEKGDLAGAKAVYISIIRLQPLSMLGAHSALMLKKLGGEKTYDAEVADLEAYGRTIPAWIEQMIPSPRMTQSLLIDFDRLNVGALERVVARVRVRNVSPIPLGVGSARTINSRLFFGPNLQIGHRERSDNAAGEVLELDRKLRLMPGEELSANAWPEGGLVGWLEEINADKPSRLRWRVMQGFESRPSGLRETGPGCVESSTPIMSRDSLPEARLPADKLIARIGGASESELPALLVAVRCRLLKPLVSEPPDPDAAKIAAAVVSGYAAWSPQGRLLATVVLPPACMAAELKELDALIVKDPDARVRAFGVVTRCSMVTDEVFKAALSDPDERVARLARRHMERAAGGLRTYASNGVGISTAPPVR